MKANSDKSKQSNKATRRVLAGVLCGASILSLVLSLVMPPISQAIANDDQAGAAEEVAADGATGADGTNVNGENQNSGAIEGGEDDPSNGVEWGQSGDQPEGKLQVEDNEPADGNAVMAATEGEQTKAAPDEIKDVNEFKSKLANANGVASFKLMNDVETSETITFDNGSNITLDLYGHKIKYTSPDQPLFNIIGGATLTIKDTDPKKPSDNVINSKQLDDPGQNLNRKLDCENYGKKVNLTYDTDYIPSNLIYYVTQSSPSKTDTTKTTETLYKHSVDIKGAIVACDGNANLKLINLYNKNGKGGTFNLVSGVITQKQGGSVSSLVYAEGGSIVNMGGGYVCGASSSGSGAGIMVSDAKGGASTLNLTGGVIAGNCASSGGGVYAKGSAVTVTSGVISGKVTNGVISGNSTLGAGLGGGIMAEGGIVTVSGGYITNNRMAKFCGQDGNGDHGGAGLAANSGAHVAIYGGQITGNYSDEAGGGVYVTNLDQSGMAWLDITGGIIASNVSYRSEGAGIRVGQKVDAMICGTPDNNDTPGSKVYITNNHCMSRFDWGGGGIFVQGNSNEGMEKTAGRLFVYNSYISSNIAGGYGGGVAVCPTGKTLVTNTNGTAIFGNKSAGAEYDNDDHNSKPYDKDNNSGNDVTPHLSGGGSGKNQDKDAYRSKVFRDRGHADFFLVAAAGHQEPLAAVIGKMLGDGDAKYSGSKERSDTKELSEPIDIPANGGVKIYRSVGLSSGVIAGSDEAKNAKKFAGTFITGNYSWDHGGGIMSNGDLYLGQPADTYVYPSLKLKATKALNGRDLKDGEFSFTVYRKGSDDPFANGTFNRDACTKVGTANNDANGNITFNLGEQFAASGAADTITYYLVENAGKVSDIKYDPAVYEIKVAVEDQTTVLMSVPTRDDPNATIELKIHNYKIKDVSAVEYPEGKTDNLNVVKADATEGYYSIFGPDGGKTFTNNYTQYTSSGSWTPKATKVVKGGEMKEFTLKFADNPDFKNAQAVKTEANDHTTQPLEFPKIWYDLDSLKQNDADVPGRAASKTFTYYVREMDEHSTYPHYKFDQSVYRFKVVATDNIKGGIDCAVTYKKGTVGSDGNWKADVGAKELHLTETSIPTFTNTYSTSLPLSGMSGVTLTYLAGAAVLCAAAVWMHIRRKANAKGGERRE